jgi:hypothetical protein
LELTFCTNFLFENYREEEYPYPTISLLQELGTPKTYYMLSGFKCIFSSLPSSQVPLQMVVHLHPLFKQLLAWV